MIVVHLLKRSPTKAFDDKTLNRLPTKALDDKTPYEAWHGCRHSGEPPSHL